MSKSEYRAPVKETLYFRTPPERPKSTIVTPNGPRGAQKEAFWRSFGYLLRVRWEKRERRYRMRGSFIFKVSGYPKIIKFQ